MFHVSNELVNAISILKINKISSIQILANLTYIEIKQTKQTKQQKKTKLIIIKLISNNQIYANITCSEDNECHNKSS